MLFRYLTRTISTAMGQPNRFSNLLILRMPAVFAPLLSIAILCGIPLTSNAVAKNYLAAALFLRLDNMKSKVLPNLSTARYR